MEAALLLMSTFFGAFILYVLTRTGGRQPFSLFYAININLDRTAHPAIVLYESECGVAREQPTIGGERDRAEPVNA
jgi:hypothetical protein